ncbi:unnamed protein product, partial [Bubo scandiacus]
MGFPGGCPLVPQTGADAHPPTGSPGLAVHAAPCGEGRRLTFSRNSSKPSSRTLMSFWLQRDLWAPARGCSPWHITCRGGHRCPARGLALDRQHPGSLEKRHGAHMRRVPHQPTVGPHSSPLLHQGQVRRARNRDIPPALAGALSTAPCATPVPVPCGAPSAWALQGPAERLLGRGLGSCQCFL